jgi:hypothetical protein
MRRPIAERSLVLASALLWGVIEVLALLRSRRADSRHPLRE